MKRTAVVAALVLLASACASTSQEPQGSASKDKMSGMPMEKMEHKPMSDAKPMEPETPKKEEAAPK